MGLTLSVFVQTVAGRDKALAHTCAQLEQSDVGTDYTVLLGAPGKNAREHLLDVMAAIAQAPGDLVLRLEDDLDVAAHLAHNLTTWPELHNPRFGAGWVFAPGGGRSIIDYIYQRPGTCKWVTGPRGYSQAVLFWRKDVEAIREHCVQWCASNPGSAGQDLALSSAVAAMGRHICIHAPSQVEHRLEFGSRVGSHHEPLWATTCGEFGRFSKWRRTQ